MSDLNEEIIKFLSRLCRIEVEEGEIPALFADLRKIVAYVGQLKEVKVEGLTPYGHFEEQGLDSLRQDKVGPTLSRAEFLANAPDQVGGMIRVPPVIKRE